MQVYDVKNLKSITNLAKPSPSLSWVMPIKYQGFKMLCQLDAKDCRLIALNALSARHKGLSPQSVCGLRPLHPWHSKECLLAAPFAQPDFINRAKYKYK